MDGILLVLKPPGMTSFDVVAWSRKVTGGRKTGHAGTLDPSACGLLPLCIGKATKAIEAFQDFDKGYRVEMILGVSTNTQDGEGEVTVEKTVSANSKEIHSAIMGFVGKNKQIPPMYSAVKVNGKRLYALARQGIEVERRARDIIIHSINIHQINTEKKPPMARFDVLCSKGTYIRTLCHDIGESLGCGAHMSFLVRTSVGPFQLEQAVTLDEIERHKSEGTLESLMLPVDILYKAYPPVYLDDKALKRFVNGAPIRMDLQEKNPTKENIRVYTKESDFAGLGRIIPGSSDCLIKPEKLFYRPKDGV